MSEYKVDKNVPLPENRGRRWGTSVYPFRDMEVGDSFFVPASVEETVKVGKRIASAGTNRALRKDGIYFTVRKVEGGASDWSVRDVRQWRFLGLEARL